MHSFNVALGTRKKKQDVAISRIVTFYKRNYAAFQKYSGTVDSIYGFAEYTPLYGGRPFRSPELSEADIAWMYDNNIGFRIPLQSFHIDDENYKENKHFLEKYHREGNGLILVDDTVALKVRNDFPKYRLENSIIRGARSIQDIKDRLALYDFIVPDQKIFDLEMDWSALSSDEMARLRLFMTHFCVYDCPAKACHKQFSEVNYKIQNSSVAEESRLIPDMCGGTGWGAIPKTEMDISKYLEAGITNFKAYWNCQRIA